LSPHEIIPGNDAPSLERRNLRSTGPGCEFTTLNTGLKGSEYEQNSGLENVKGKPGVRRAGEQRDVKGLHLRRGLYTRVSEC
jgi:hypothetical protein